MAQAVSHRPLTAEAGFHARVLACGICCSQYGTESCISSRLSVLPVNIITPWLSVFIYHLEDKEYACWWPQFRDIISFHRHKQKMQTSLISEIDSEVRVVRFEIWGSHCGRYVGNVFALWRRVATLKMDVTYSSETLITTTYKTSQQSTEEHSRCMPVGFWLRHCPRVLVHPVWLWGGSRTFWRQILTFTFQLHSSPSVVLDLRPVKEPYEC
jgi:hypothetical protein